MSVWEDLADFFLWSFRTDFNDSRPGGSDWNQTTEWMDTQVFPYLPGFKEKQKMDDEARYWKDYKETTGYTPRYPGRTIKSPDLGDLAGTWDWWKIW